jgi:hypothetical protein
MQSKSLRSWKYGLSGGLKAKILSSAGEMIEASTCASVFGDHEN